MATRTIASPGIQINEVDLSIIARPTAETNVFMTGFAPQGPTDEIVNVGSISEFESIFGTPENAAERYLYHSAKQILNGSGNLLVTRVPYGSGSGAGFANSYSALVYPVSSTDDTSYEKSTAFQILEPYSILLTSDEYQEAVEGAINWNTSLSPTNSSISCFADIKKGGIVVLNSSKTAINNLFEGYYVGLADNSNNNPSTDFDAVQAIRAANSITNGNYQSFVTVPSTRLSFTLTSYASAYGTGSVSETIEGLPNGYDFGNATYNDSLTLAVFKVRSSIYNQDTVTLDYLTTEGYTGSLNANRTQNDPNGGTPKSFFLDSKANLASPNIKVITNPYISTKGTWMNADASIAKTVRVNDAAKKIYSVGVYANDTDNDVKDIGNLPKKVQRSLRMLENSDDIVVDVVAEAGLGTIWTGSKAYQPDDNKTRIFDDTFNVDIDALYNTDSNTVVEGVRDDYLSIANQFVTFAQTIRKDHIFIADGLRYIYVQGVNAKIAKRSDFIFSTNIYWALKNLFAGVETSYASVYGNWLKLNDTASDKQVWVPPSGFIAAKCAEVDRTAYPWSAIGGFNRGMLTGITDIGVVTTQKQRDLLYKTNVNPIAYFPNDGFVLYGQKTLYKKPSAFDRINVRRLFLFLEKNTQAVLKYFLFEPNTFTTRTRLVGALTPIFEMARINDGVYAYQIVCDERNNTPDVIDANELRVSLYIQPVRTAEFILADFIATRTGVNFNELIG
jgi:hypothetical protein